jgi:Flp pilus assembly protein TadG
MARPLNHDRKYWPSGKALVMFAVSLPALLGIIGLVIDSGLLMAAQRQTQNAADAAAGAAAMDLFRGSDSATATSTANSFLANNGLSGVTLTLNGGSNNAINVPPSQGPFSGQNQYVEAIVSQTVTTSFIQLLGVNKSQTVKARAVAGYEPVGAGEGVFVLDSTASPGLDVSNNNARLIVNGDITVNSAGGGVDQFGNTVSSALNADGVKVQNSTLTPAPIVAQVLNVVGGVSNVDNIRAYDASFGPTNYYDPNNNDRPVFARAATAPDPLVNLATPTTSSAGTAVVNTNYGSVSVQGGQTVTLNPGIYSSIKITGGTVTFNPGIYVLQPAGNVTNTIDIGGGTLTGNGVMFYNTGSDYNPVTGAPDNSDGNLTPNPPNSTNFGAIKITGGTVNFVPLIDANSPFNGLLFYQRRWNNNGASVTGNASLSLQGTFYAKWAAFTLAGNGSYQAQFLVGSMSIGGGAAVTINAAGKNAGKANLVFLVE